MFHKIYFLNFNKIECGELVTYVINTKCEKGKRTPLKSAVPFEENQTERIAFNIYLVCME